MVQVRLPLSLGSFALPIATVDPRKADGTVQFVVDGHNLDGAVTVHGGNAVGPLTPLGKGPHSVTAQFTPADSAAFKPSISNTVTFTL